MRDLPAVEARLLQYLESRQDHYFELLRRMVAINSFSFHRQGIEELGRLTAAVFEGLGFTSEFVPAEDPACGRHLLLSRPGPSPTASRIALVSHLDTVFTPEEEKSHHFHWREDGDRIYGPGTVDIKGGTVVAYMMLDALRAVVPESLDAVRWMVGLNAAEEQLYADFSSLVVEHLEGGPTLACLVFEGGLMRGDETWTVVARKGRAVFEVTVEGRAAHSGSGHEHGANAVVQLADVVREISTWTDYERQLTFNVGVVEGGTVVNRVPHAARAKVEMRAFDTEVFEAGIAKMTALGEYSTVRSAADGFPCVVRVDARTGPAPWPRNTASDRLLAIWQEAGASVGIRVHPEERGGLSDGNLLWTELPTLDGMGPSGANAHCSEQSEDGSKEQEYATRSSFVPRAVLNASAVLRLIEATEPG